MVNIFGNIRGNLFKENGNEVSYLLSDGRLRLQ